MRLLIVFLTFFSFLGCTKKPIDQTKPEQPPKDSAYVWRQLIYPENISLVKIERGGFARKTDGGNLIGFLSPLAAKDITTLMLYNPNTKQFVWKWKDYYSDAKQFPEGGFIFPDYYYVGARKEQYCFSLETGETISKYRIPTDEIIEPGNTIFGDKIYHVRRRGAAAQPNETTLYMSTTRQQEWEPIFQVKQENDYGAGLELPVISKDADGDTILFFQNRQYRYYAPRNKTDFYAYNLTKKEVLWKQENISSDVSNKSRPVLDEVNKRLYFVTRYTVFCWDMVSGEEIWRIDLDYAGLLSSDYIYHDGKVITVTDQGYLIAFDGDTGQRLYYEKKGGCCVSGIVVHKDRIYYTDTDLFVSDLNTGKTVWKYNEDGRFNGFPVFDDAKGVMYLMSRYYIYALKIPE